MTTTGPQRASHAAPVILAVSAIVNCLAVGSLAYRTFDLPLWIAAPTGFVCGNIPIAGSIAAGFGAVLAWHWPVWAGVAVAALPPLLFILALRASR